MKQIFCFAVIFNLVLNNCICDDESLPPPCSSKIYCHGPLLHTIQMSAIHPDSKTFVDMKLKYPENETLDRFYDFMLKNDNKPNKTLIRQFVSNTFEKVDQEFETWTPNDWKNHPKFINNIKDDEFREWALQLNHIWKLLGRKMKKEVEDNKELYSIIWIPNPVIVPGGRFREFYYWDSYWIIQGLLLSEMLDTAKGMLENFLFIVDNYGHIPNGGRIYYLERSQPPLMVPMIKAYYDATNDTNFIANNVHIMEKEFDYWLTSHTKVITFNGKNYTLAVYGDKSKGPRPESYSEDIKSAEIFKDDEKRENYYSELKAAAESGWDFSSRWFITTNATNKGNLTNIKTRSIVPVDLNSILYWNAVILSEFNQMLENYDKAYFYSEKAKEFFEGVTAVLWHEEVGAWLDYDVHNGIKRDYFYPTNISPLWTGCYNKTDKDKIVRLVLKYLQNKNIMYPGGVPTTVEHTGEQWDYPNAWPPLQHMMIAGLNNTGDEAAKRLAFEIAEIWVRSNFKAFKEESAMYEKYDATVFGGYGGGGEYQLQLGFGWTNGIIMELLDKYADVLREDDPPPSTASPMNEAQSSTTPTSASFSQISAALIAVVVSLSAGFIGVCIYKRRQSQALGTKTKQRPSRARYTELKSMTRHPRSAR